MDEITEKISVGQISSSHVSKLIAIEGRINKILPIKSKLIEGAFQCQRCAHVTRFQQPLSDKLIKPYECDSDECGRKGPFKLIPEESKWIDEQRLELQDLDDQMRDITVLVRGQNLIDTVPAEDAHVIITGIVRVIEKDGSNLFDKVLEANHIERKDMPKSQRDKVKMLREIIRELQDDYKGAVPIGDITIKAEESGIKKEAVQDLIQSLKSVGELIESSNERFRVI